MVLSALFGVFGGKATIDVLKTVNGIMGDLKDFFLRLFTFGKLLSTLIFLVFMFFLSLFLLLVSCVSYVLLGHLGCAF